MDIQIGDQVQLIIPMNKSVPGGRSDVHNKDIGIVRHMYEDYHQGKKVTWINIQWITGICTTTDEEAMRYGFDRLWTTTANSVKVILRTNRSSISSLKRW